MRAPGPSTAQRWRLRLVVLAAVSAWWILMRPPEGIVIGPAYDVGPTPAAITAVTSADDPIAAAARTAPALPGYDEIVLQEDRGRAFATAIDGWIWEIDLATGGARRLVETPLMPAGARAVPGDPDRILFCASRYGTGDQPPGEQVGLYELVISTRAVRPVALRVPRPPPSFPPTGGNVGTVATPTSVRPVPLAELDTSNSRPIAFCNDLDVSADGARVYFSEPSDAADASMGDGAVREGIALGQSGRLWRIDRTAGTAALIAQGYTFLDGVLLEAGADGAEQSVLITETPKCRILRLHIAGAEAGRDRVLWEGLPAMPDGMDRDAAGRIWVGMVRERSGLVGWVHRNPWVKPLLLRLPLAALPLPDGTGILALGPDAETALYFAPHDGAAVREISVAVPGRDRLYLPSFAHDSYGLVTMSYPPGLEPGAAG